MSRRGFTTVELMVAILLLGVCSGAAWYMFSGGMKQMSASADNQVALRNALLMSTALDQDLRAAAVLNQRQVSQQPFPLSPQSVVLSRARCSLRLRISAPIERLDADPASRFTIVTYQLVELKDRKYLYRVRREERTVSGAKLSGERVATRSHTFEDLTIGEMRYRFAAWLGPLEWRQFLKVRIKSLEGQRPDGMARHRELSRQFDIPVPQAVHGSAGGPLGFALDFPPSALASQLSGSVDIVGRPGNLDPLEPPPDAVDQRGEPVEVPLEQQIKGIPDPFVRLEPSVPPLRSQFLHAAVGRLEAALGSNYRGIIASSISANVPGGPAGDANGDLFFRLDATENCPRPVILQINELFEKAKTRGAAGILQLAYRFQMETIPGVDKPPLEAARMLLEERRTGNP